MIFLYFEAAVGEVFLDRTGTFPLFVFWEKVHFWRKNYIGRLPGVAPVSSVNEREGSITSTLHYVNAVLCPVCVFLLTSGGLFEGSYRGQMEVRGLVYALYLLCICLVKAWYIVANQLFAADFGIGTSEGPMFLYLALCGG